MIKEIFIKMNDSDINRILNFFLGNEKQSEFEQWLYTDSDLESRIGSELYFDLVDHNYQKRDIVHEVKKSVLDKYISREVFKTFKYCSVLKKGGWFEGRKIEVDSTKIPETPGLNNAIKIIEEFGGLTFNSLREVDYWTPKIVEFPNKPGEVKTMHQYGINKELICFAFADHGDLSLYVDECNSFYSLDNIASIDLYEYKGYNFEEMMYSLLGIEDSINNHRIIGSKNHSY